MMVPVNLLSSLDSPCYGFIDSMGLVARTLSGAAFSPIRADTAKSPAGRTPPGCNKAARSAAGWSRPKRDCQLN